MALYLVTGQPGHGKTAYAVDKAFQFKKEGRAVYAHGVKDLDYEKAGFAFIEDPTKWEDLPDGSVVLLDECYTAFPNRNPGAKVPPHVEAMARHRHRGFDFILVAQQGLQLDPFLRGLYEEHVHVRQTSVFKSKTKLKRWTQYQNNTHVRCADVEDWIRPKYVFEYYTSTTLVTTKRSMPMWLRWLLVAFGILAIALLAIKWYFSVKIAEYSQPATTTTEEAATAARRGAEGAAGVADDAPRWTGDPDDPLYRTDYARDHLPRFATMPWTAPIYDQRQPLSDPQLVCMSAQAGMDSTGHHRDASCTCLSEQGTRYDISEPECRHIARQGPVYNPYRQPQAPAMATAASAPPQPPVVDHGAIVKAPQITGYGDLAKRDITSAD